SRRCGTTGHGAGPAVAGSAPRRAGSGRGARPAVQHRAGEQRARADRQHEAQGHLAAGGGQRRAVLVRGDGPGAPVVAARGAAGGVARGLAVRGGRAAGLVTGAVGAARLTGPVRRPGTVRCPGVAVVAGAAVAAVVAGGGVADADEVDAVAADVHRGVDGDLDVVAGGDPG